MSNFEDRVKRIVADKLEVKRDQIASNSKFIEDLGADSLDAVEIIMALEDEFNIEIPDEDAKKLTTVKDVLDYLGKKIP